MPRNFTVRDEFTPRFGTHEICLETHSNFGNPYRDVDLQVAFFHPDGSVVTVDGFYDGGTKFKARAYCDTVGVWSWRVQSDHPDLAEQHGAFEVIPSGLKGKLRIHPRDPHQFAFDNGEWFLHIGDTGYRYVCAAEPNWKEYIEQAAASGITKIRTWFCLGRSDVQALFETDRSRLNLPYWREIDRRVRYALNHFPDVMLQLIPYGEDAGEVYRYFEGDPDSAYIARYAQARFSSLANVTWCMSNDLRIVPGIESGLFPPDWEEERKADLTAGIDAMGRDMAEREPWLTLITNHQHRFSGYSFLDSSWSNITTLEGLGQVAGELVLKYRALSNTPVVLDEDRYELYQAPENRRYFFRRLMWSNLLSGGHASYGGAMTFVPYDGDSGGIHGYYRLCTEGKLYHGAHDFRFIRRFFDDSRMTLVGMVPDDNLTGNKPLCIKSIRSPDSKRVIVYFANPDVFEGHAPDGFGGVYTDKVANPATGAYETVLALPEGNHSVRWFDPSNGSWQDGDSATGGDCKLETPGGGDWVLLLVREM